MIGTERRHGPAATPSAQVSRFMARQGGGKQVRSIRLETAAKVDTQGVRALLDAWLAEADPPIPLRGRGRAIIKSVSAKQRTQRPKARR